MLETNKNKGMHEVDTSSCGSMGPRNECLPIMISLAAQEIMVAADMASSGTITRMFSNLDRK